MFCIYNPNSLAVSILTESEHASLKEEREIEAVLEDAKSPITNEYIAKLYDSVISKNHVDFGDIPNSKGNIVEYSGYTNLIKVLENLTGLASIEKSNDVIEYVNSVNTAIENMRKLAPVYRKGFIMKNEYVTLEYNLIVYTIVQAVSSILYQFVDWSKSPANSGMPVALKDTKYRANTFYIDSLYKFNMANKNMPYAKYLESMLQNGRNNFTGVEAVGLATVVAISLAIIPLLRELVYRYYNLKSSLSDCLAQQAYFLELNKGAVEANSDFNQHKKEVILAKQEKIKNMCIRLSDKLRVSHNNATSNAKATLSSENKLLTIDNIKKEIGTGSPATSGSDESFTLL